MHATIFMHNFHLSCLQAAAQVLLNHHIQAVKTEKGGLQDAKPCSLHYHYFLFQFSSQCLLFAQSCLSFAFQICCDFYAVIHTEEMVGKRSEKPATARLLEPAVYYFNVGF